MATRSGFSVLAPTGGKFATSISEDLNAYAGTLWPTSQAAAGVHGGAAAINSFPVSSHAVARAGFRQRSYLDDFYYRIHLSPRRIDLGNTLPPAEYTVAVWNAYFTPQALANIDAPEGVELTPTGAAAFAPLQSRAYTVTVTADGPAEIVGGLTLDWTGIEDGALPMTGTRILAWSWLPDWGGGVVERLEWKTDVLSLADGAEQRISVRYGARRGYQFAVAAEGAARRYLEAALWSWGGRTWALPLWHDATALAADLAAGVLVVPVDTTGREFVAGGMLMLLGDGARDCEAVNIEAVTPGQVTLVRATTRAWPRGTRVLPAFPALLLDDAKLPRFTGDATRQGEFRFEFTDPWDGAPATLPLYRGQPVLEHAPNWARELSLELSRKLAELDPLTGPWVRVDLAGRPVAAQTHGWTLVGREAVIAHRGLLAALRGRQGGIWVPTWTMDLLPIEVANATSSTLVVDWAGYSRYHNLAAGRRDIRIELVDGTVLYRRILEALELDSAREALTLDAQHGVAINPAEVLRISYLALCRQKADAAELAHWTSDVAQSTTTWQSFRHDL